MVWWIAAKLLAPFAKGALGNLVKLALVVAIVVVAGYAADVDVLAVTMQLAATLTNDVISAIADAVANEVTP